MKRTKKLGIMLGVLALLCVMTFAISMVKEKKENIEISGETILSIPTETVKSFTWTEGEDTLAFHRTESGWAYDEDENFPASTEKVEALLKPFAAFGAGFTIEEAEDLGLYGLAEPTAKLTIETEEQTYEILMGDYSQMDQQRYVSIGDGKVYLAAHDPCDDFSEKTLRDLIQNDEVPDFHDTAKTIRFTGAETYEVTRRDRSDSYRPEDLWYTERDGAELALNPAMVDDYLSQLNSGMLYNYTDYYAEGDDLAAYGLREPELTVEVVYSTVEEQTFTLHIGLDPEQAAQQADMTEEERENADPIAAYAQVEGSHIVYRLDSTTYEQLARYRVDDLRHREVIPADVSAIQSLDVTLDGANCRLTTKQKEEKQVWYRDEKELTASDLTEALSDLRVDQFTDEQPGDNKLEISFTAVLDLTGEPKVKVELYRYDGMYCLAVVNGRPLGLVLRSDTVDLMEAVNRILLAQK